MSASKHIRIVAGYLKVAAFSAYLFCAAGTATAALDIPDSPLFLTGGVKPNLIMAVDDSLSMDLELLVPTNDGSAWWRTASSLPTGQGTCDASTNNSFVGCGTNGSTTVPASGATNRSGTRLNFNHYFDNASYTRYSYLFPNANPGRAGSGNAQSIPPLGAFAWARSAEHNTAYFDPAQTYTPWPSNGSYTFTAASKTAAKFDPVYSAPTTIDLTKDLGGATGVTTTAACNNTAMTSASYISTWAFEMQTGMVLPVDTCIRANGRNWEVVTTACTVGNTCNVKDNGTAKSFTLSDGADLDIRFFPATFYSSSQTALTGYNATFPAVSNGVAPDGTTLYRYEIKSGNFSSTAAYDAAIQNFANWFTYYRKRHQSLRAGLGTAFNSLTAMRVGGFTINGASLTGPDVTMGDIDDSSYKSTLFTNFYSTWMNTLTASTPNRLAIANLVRNYERTDNGSPSRPVTASCQRNFGMLFTDGFSNVPASTDGIYSVTNQDGDGGAYAGAPYADTAGKTMADYVMKSYRSIRSPASGNLQLPAACADATHDPWLDCNKNLHMNFYGVTLGASGLLFDPDVLANWEAAGKDLRAFPYSATAPAGWSGTWPVAWPSEANVLAADHHPTAVDDLWHAAINGRGLLMNAKNGNELGAKLTKILTSIADVNGSASAAAVNSGTINSDTRLFQASFSTKDWSGELRAFDVQKDNPATTANEEGTLSAPILATIPAAGSRQILSTDSTGAGIAFQWASLDATRKASLKQAGTDALGQSRLEYVRGVQTSELPSGTFRKRTTILGDIVGSAPVFVGPPPFRYPDSLESASYSQFKADNASRQHMIYVGANDGMLHAFRSNDTGDGAVSEVFAFVPGAVYDNLHHLSDTGYSHKFYADGTPSVVDAYFGSAWHSVLVGGLNAGGKGIYALDVTNPLGVTEAGAASTVLWERTSASTGFSDLGYTFSRPTIARVKYGSGGKWVAIFGNGYNSTAGKAVLYVVDLQNGTLLKSMEVVNAASPAAGNNGLSTPAVVDLQGDGNADYVYAGDLYGNMWRFDLTSNATASWTSRLLFAAGSAQPITDRPQVGPGQNGLGMVVLFGTGKFLETNDRTSPGATQSFYGIFDPNTVAYTAPVLANLLQQTVIGTATAPNGLTVRVTSDNAMTAGKKGWYINLPTSGERQVADPVLRNGRVVFTTIIPSTDPCSYGGSSWVMDLDALGGSRLSYSPFDLDGNNRFNEQDYVTVTISGVPVQVPASGIYNEALMTRPAFVAGDNNEYAFTTDTSGNINTNRVNPGPAGVGRQSWRQLR